jgi:hypothetical protein
MFNPDFPPASVYVPLFETAARSLKIASITAPVHSDVEIFHSGGREGNRLLILGAMDPEATVLRIHLVG